MSSRDRTRCWRDSCLLTPGIEARFSSSPARSRVSTPKPARRLNWHASISIFIRYVQISLVLPEHTWPIACKCSSVSSSYKHYDSNGMLGVIFNVLEINTWPHHVFHETSGPVNWTTHSTGYNRGAQIFQKSRNHLKIFDARNVTRNRSHTEGPQILNASGKTIYLSQITWHLLFVQPYATVHPCKNMRRVTVIKGR
jgi:hypothetical protein